MNIQKLLTPKQKLGWKLLCTKNMYTALYGGSRSGKTFLIVCYLIALSMLRTSRHLAVRKYLSDILKAVWYETLPTALDLLELPSSAYKMNQNLHRITFKNGSEIWFGGMENKRVQDKILGKEYSTAWINEASEFDCDLIPNIMTRLAQKSGIFPRLMLDFNPPETTHWTYDLINEGMLINDSGDKVNVDISYLLMNPFDNTQNLNPQYIQLLESLPERQKKRFLTGEFVSPTEAIFSQGMIRYTSPENPRPPVFDKVIIGIDPATTNKLTSDETGIFVIGRIHNKYYKLRDLSCKANPEDWATRAVKEYLFWKMYAKNVHIVAEVNQGGDMVGVVINNVAKKLGAKVNYVAVHTIVSKQYRAEEFSVLLATQEWYWWHESDFRVYNKQLLGYTHLIQNKKSPDRVDAAIIAASQLQDDKRRLFYGAV